MLIPNRSASAEKYRYGFQGQEKDDEIKGEGNSLNYTFRMHDPRVGRFFAVDPLTKKYPHYSPYAFSGNRVIDAWEIEGLEPSKDGTSDNEYQIANKSGTNDSYGYTWTKDSKSKKYSWLQGSSTNFQNGNIATASSFNDNNKNYFPNINVGSIVPYAKTTNDPKSVDNTLNFRLNDFTDKFELGINLEDAASQNEAIMLENNFINGNGTGLSFRANSKMSGLLGKDSAFTSYAESFENNAINYYKKNKTLEGFDGSGIMKKLKNPYIKDTWFMHTVLGGTQQWNAHIKSISANDIEVLYTAYDRFGAGTDDATKSSLPGLPSLYWLQHNATHYYPNMKNHFIPFTWSINVLRK